MVETMRECLRDVYDLPALEKVVAAVGTRSMRVAEITTDTPSPFAESLLFSYTGAFLYEGDSAERAAALTVDPALLAAVLGARGEGLVLDPDVVTEVVESLQWLSEGRRARSAEQVVDMLRALGPLAPGEVARRTEDPQGALASEVQAMIPRRICEVKVGGVLRWAVVEDITLLRDGLGIPVPPGVAAARETVADAVDQLVLRWARTHGPFTATDIAEEFGLGVATADSLAKRWVSGRRLESHSGEDGDQYVDAGVLRRLRAATLAKARGALEPVSVQTYAAVLADWHGLGTGEREDLPVVIEQLAGVALPASAWETVVLPSRIPGYRTSDLDDLIASGEVLVVGAGTTSATDPRIMLLPADLAPLLVDGMDGLEDADEPDALGPIARLVRDRVSGGGAFLASEIERGLGDSGGAGHDAVDSAIWELFDAGQLMPDSFAPVRARLAGTGITDRAGSGAHKAPRRNRGRGTTRRLRMGRSTFAQSVASEEVRSRRAAMNAHSGVPGRWSQVPEKAGAATDRAIATGEAWLDRYAVVTRGAVMSEHTEGGFAAAYRMLTAWEDNGTVLRGYIVDGLGGAQFASREVIDQLRRVEENTGAAAEAATSPVLLAASDPANPYGAAVPWPELPTEDAPRPTRGAGALVVLREGRLLAHLTRGGRTVTVFTRPALSDGPVSPDPGDVAAVVAVLSDAVQAGRLSPVTVERINGADVMGAATGPWTESGARLTPKGLVVR